MTTREEVQDHRFDEFMNGQAAEFAELDLPDGVLEFLRLTQETAFRAGWDSGQQWQDDQFRRAPTAKLPKNVRLLVTVGDGGWVQPFAIVEHTATGDMFVDPRFSVTECRSDEHSVHLVRTEGGFVGKGPTDQHRLHDHPPASSFVPLLQLSPE